MSENYLFTSERLGFRNWLSKDITGMTAISADPAVMRYFPAPATPEQTVSFIERMKIMLRDKGYCYFAVDELKANQFIGFIGMYYQTFESPFTPAVDIGWRLAKAFWGKGFATEGAKRCLEYAFKDLQIPALIATAPQVNKPSIHVMEKIGMHKLMDFKHPRLKGFDHLEHCVCYAISA
jgi:RimJ/RimL family protein N-acetyltransferase